MTFTERFPSVSSHRPEPSASLKSSILQDDDLGSSPCARWHDGSIPRVQLQATWTNGCRGRTRGPAGPSGRPRAPNRSQCRRTQTSSAWGEARALHRGFRRPQGRSDVLSLRPQYPEHCLAEGTQYNLCLFCVFVCFLFFAIITNSTRKAATRVVYCGQNKPLLTPLGLLFCCQAELPFPWGPRGRPRGASLPSDLEIPRF